MRRQPGAQRPRGVLHRRNRSGRAKRHLPAVSWPDASLATILLKQGRAFGVSCILATQNAKDIDYKGLGQIDTWLVGRLKTKADMERLKLGMEAAQTEATHNFGDQADELLSRVAGLAPGSLVIKARGSGVRVYKQRWIRCLHERLTPERVKRWARAEGFTSTGRWSGGSSGTRVARRCHCLSGTVIAAQPYYTQSPRRSWFCERLFRSGRSRAAECASASRDGSCSGLRTHALLRGAELQAQQFDRAREALGASASAGRPEPWASGAECWRSLHRAGRLR
jgi:hypothetical protein